mmetsp:Transcript_1997/g.4618  ORF Transcript_1997/g.4618 Transcript_1997/m.4618 type:complete len:229 (+) Transcript_1997:1207-1893(+)
MHTGAHELGHTFSQCGIGAHLHHREFLSAIQQLTQRSGEHRKVVFADAFHIGGTHTVHDLSRIVHNGNARVRVLQHQFERLQQGVLQSDGRNANLELGLDHAQLEESAALERLHGRGSRLVQRGNQVTLCHHAEHILHASGARKIAAHHQHAMPTVLQVVLGSLQQRRAVQHRCHVVGLTHVHHIAQLLTEHHHQISIVGLCVGLQSSVRAHHEGGQIQCVHHAHVHT